MYECLKGFLVGLLCDAVALYGPHVQSSKKLEFKPTQKSLTI